MRRTVSGYPADVKVSMQRYSIYLIFASISLPTEGLNRGLERRIDGEYGKVNLILRLMVYGSSLT